MANSLMELYGGGMVGNRTNYQLGGRIAASRRRRDYQGEMRELDRAAREAQRKQSRASGLGSILSTVGSIAGSFIPIPGVGTALGSAIGSAAGGGLGRLLGESTYQGTKVQGGKYAQESRGNLQGSVDDFKRSMGERALGQGLRSGLGTFISSGGIGETKDFLARRYGVDSKTGKLNKLGKAFAEKVTEQGMADNPFLATEGLEELTDEQLLDFLPANPDYNPLPTPVRPDVPMDFGELSIDTVSDMPLNVISDTPLTDFSYDDLVQYGTFQGPTMDFMPAMRGGGMVNMMPKYEYGGFVKEAEKERFDAMNRPTFFGDQANSAEENRGFMPRTTSVGSNIGMPIQNNYGYGTATSAAGALRQMGMEDVLNDPRFAEFADDLPQFSMGYQQQIGDIQSGGQQAAQQFRTRQRQSGSGFTGFGAGQTQLQQNFRNLGTDMQRQQRGVIEGFQADLLSAVGDIEAKGQFEFGSGPTSTTNPNEALDMIEEAKDMINSGSPLDRLRGEAVLKELENQGYNIA
jgi:hypothetical protein